MATTDPTNAAQFSNNRVTNMNNDMGASAALTNIVASVMNADARRSQLESYELLRALIVGGSVTTMTDATTTTAITSANFTGS